MGTVTCRQTNQALIPLPGWSHWFTSLLWRIPALVGSARPGAHPAVPPGLDPRASAPLGGLAIATPYCGACREAVGALKLVLGVVVRGCQK